MKISMTYEALETALGTVTGVLADRLLQEDLKNIIFLIKENKVQLTTYSSKITCFADVLDVDIEREDGEEMEFVTQLQAKDFQAILGVLKGLTCTKVSKLQFNFLKTDTLLEVHEEPKDETMEGAEKYFQVSKYRLATTRLKESIRKDILAQDTTNTEAVTVESADLLVYLDALIPTITGDTRDTPATRLNWGEDFVYTVPHTYGAVMQNRLKDSVSGFVLTTGIAQFLKTFVSNEEYVSLHKEEKGELVILKVSNSYAVAIIRALHISKAFNVTNFIDIPEEGIAVDKGYLSDVLRRMTLNGEAVDVTVDLDEEEFSIVCKKLTQSIPIIKCKGSGKYTFSVKADLFANLIFNHVTMGEYIFLKFEREAVSGAIVLGVKDSMGLWHTKIKGLTPVKGGNFLW